MVARKLSAAEQRHIDLFWKRKAAWLKRPRVNNADLQAGSPMWYYCKACGKLIAQLPETHVEAPPQHCDDCAYLIEHALMPPPGSKPPAEEKPPKRMSKPPEPTQR